jgi:hypothetical protein
MPPVPENTFVDESFDFGILLKSRFDARNLFHESLRYFQKDENSKYDDQGQKQASSVSGK